MAIEWNTQFTIPVLQQLDKGLVGNNEQFARLIAAQYAVAISTGGAVGVPPTPFLSGNITGMARIIEQWLNFNRLKFLQSDIKAQRNQVRLINLKIKQYTTLSRDLQRQLRDISAIEREITSYSRRVKSKLKTASKNQLISLQESITAFKQLPDTLLQREVSALEQQIQIIDKLLEIKPQDLISPDKIFSKAQSVSILLRTAFAQINRLRTVSTISVDTIASSVVYSSFGQLNIDSFFDAFELDRFGVLAIYVQKAKQFIQKQINRLRDSIQHIIKTQKEKINERIKRSQEEKATLGKIVTFNKVKSLIRQIKSVSIKQIKSISDAIKNISRRLLQIVGRIKLIFIRVNRIKRQVQSVKSSGIQYGLIDVNSLGTFSSTFTPTFANMSPTEQGAVISLGLVTEIQALSQELLALRREANFYTQRRSKLFDKINSIKQKQNEWVSKIQQELQPFNSFANKAILAAKQARNYRAQLLMYKTLIKSTKVQLVSLKSTVNFLKRLILQTQIPNPSINQLKRLQRTLSSSSQFLNKNIFTLFNARLDSILSIAGTIDSVLLRSELLGLNTIATSAFKPIIQQIDNLELMILSLSTKYQTRMLSAAQQKINPLSLSFTSSFSRAIRIFWLNGRWIDPTGTFIITVPGNSLIGSGFMFKAKPSTSSAELISEMASAFRIHSNTIQGTYLNNQSNVMTPWIGYL